MKMYDVILKKRNGETLTDEEIRFFVKGYSDGSIPDYQAAAFLMACYFNELSAEETKELTIEMKNSGGTVDLSRISGHKADKHSTGGVADTTTLVLAPLVAACGLKLAKMSGRGLGHTGGTLDKMESIPGVTTSLSMDAFVSQVNDIGFAVMGQTMSLCPADKKMYALRDVTATVDSIPLIASSIMSKKLASGADIIVLDVKTGSGAFMKTLESAKSLAKIMVEIGKLAGKKTVALVTDMNQPLGCAVGNAIEVMEAVEILKGEREGDLKTVALELASELLVLGGVAKDKADAIKKLEKAISDGSGIEKLRALVKAQGGNPNAIDEFSLFDKAAIKQDFICEKSGYISKIDAEKIGMASSVLGAGREKKEDDIDMSVGIWMKKRLGDKVKKGDVLFKIYANDKAKLSQAKEMLSESVQTSDKINDETELIYAIID